MRVLVTGSKGFIGKNLVTFLKEKEELDVLEFDAKNSLSELEDVLEGLDFIFHLAGVNRVQSSAEFYEGNRDLTKNLIHLLQRKKLSIPLVMTSSIQAILDNDYGKSKKQAEDAVLDYAKNSKSYVYRLHNVFGKWARPDYNSALATFCYNIANDLPIQINNPDLGIELVYIDDICHEFMNLLSGETPSDKNGSYCYIHPQYRISVGELAQRLLEFKKSISSLTVPSTGETFTKKLYSTFVSYLPLEKMVLSLRENEDERGNFVELVRTNESGQFAVSFSKPNVFRGDHYHNTKMERFIVVKGKAKIRLKNIDDGKEHEFEVSGKKVQSVMIPPGCAHSIENVGDEEMILVIWTNELFVAANPDTFFRKVAER